MTIDTLIIGSGVVAAAISQRLLSARPDMSILILEAGQKVKLQDQRLWQDFVVNGLSYSKLPYAKYNDLPFPDRDQQGENVNIGSTVVPLSGSRVITYGGSTIHWGGWSFRLKREDFRMKTNTDTGIDWPFDYDVLEPYYCQAEDYIGVAGDSADEHPSSSHPYPFPVYPYTYEDQPVKAALTALNWSFSHVPIARHGIKNTTALQAPCKTTGTCKYCPFGARYAAPNFLDDMLQWGDYPNLEVRIDAVVDVINVDAKDHVTGVTYRDQSTGEDVTVEARRVIVAAGAIESPKLLLRSRSSFWPQGIGNDHDLVGRYFVTHPYFIFSATIDKNSRNGQAEMDFPTLCSRHFDSPEEQAKGKFILVNPPSSPTPLVNQKTMNIIEMMQSGMTREEILAAMVGPAQVQIHGMLEIPSERHNRVMNLESCNRMGLLETVVDYSKSPDFKHRMSEITARVDELFKQLNATPRGNPYISWRADHSACTCRMATSPEEGVTDENLKVFGVKNLYVCSNAVFPNTGAINPTLTLTALSLRLGDHLIQDDSQGGRS